MMSSIPKYRYHYGIIFNGTLVLGVQRLANSEEEALEKVKLTVIKNFKKHNIHPDIFQYIMALKEYNNTGCSDFSGFAGVPAESHEAEFERSKKVRDVLQHYYPKYQPRQAVKVCSALFLSSKERRKRRKKRR